MANAAKKIVDAGTTAPLATHEPLSSADRTWLRQLIADKGEAEAIAFVGLSRNAVTRALAGLPVLRGTHAVIRLAREGR